MRASLYSVKDILPGTISIMARPRGGDWLPDEIEAINAAGVHALVSLLTAEEEAELDLTAEAACCKQQGILYYSLPIIDRSVPPFTADTFLFIERLYARLTEGKHVTIHCRQGLGRAALIAASILVLGGLTVEQACDLLGKARGYAVPETEEQRAWIVAFAKRASR